MIRQTPCVGLQGNLLSSRGHQRRSVSFAQRGVRLSRSRIFTQRNQKRQHDTVRQYAGAEDAQVPHYSRHVWGHYAAPDRHVVRSRKPLMQRRL